MAVYRVSPGTQVHHEGTTYGEGETVDATPEQARLWLLGGYVTEVKPRAKRAKAVEDKAVTTAD